MKSMKCRDLGMDCNFVATGETVDEVKNKAFDHARTVHAEMFKDMNTPQQMADMEMMVVSKIS